MTKNALYTVVTLLADALLIFRTYVVWGRNAWIVLVPTLVFIVDFGAFLFLLYRPDVRAESRLLH